MTARTAWTTRRCHACQRLGANLRLWTGLGVSQRSHFDLIWKAARRAHLRTSQERLGLGCPESGPSGGGRAFSAKHKVGHRFRKQDAKYRCSRLDSRMRSTKWLASLIVSQDRKTSGSCSEVFNCVPAQNRSNRIDLLIVEFKQLSKRIEHGGDDPIGCSCVFWCMPESQV
jgi:hypothetical protein